MEKQVTTGTMLAPKYVGRFSCIGSDCPDTCCSMARVPLDKDTFAEYEGCQDSDLRPLMEKHVKGNPAPQADREYGYIEASPSCQECPFLDPSKLCIIQTRLGETGLSDACDAFPRSTIQFGEIHQMVMNLSCPEVARLALLEEDAFDLEIIEASVRSGMVAHFEPKGPLSMEDMDEVRTQMFQILLTRELDLSKRLAVLGFFCLRLTELLEQGLTSNLQGLIRTMNAVVENGAIQIPLKSLDQRQYIQAMFAWDHLAALENGSLSPRSRKVMDAVILGLGIPADGTPDEAALMHGLEVGTPRLDEALQAAPRLLEHYLFNEALREVFPWSDETPYRHFINLLLDFTLLRVMLVGRAAAQEAILTPSELVETVQVFVKCAQPGAKMVDKLKSGFALGDWTSLGSLLEVV